jgi:hypothetical protein
MAAIEKVSSITAAYLAQYLRIVDPTEAQTQELETFLTVAKNYVSSYVGLPITAPADDPETTDVDESDVETLDSHAEFVAAVCVLVQNQYDNRTFYTDKGKIEDVVNSILGMHRKNLLS